MTPTTLCIFARAPVLGAVKTRLAAVLGDQAALDAHVELVEDTLRRLARLDGIVSELWLDDVRHAAAVQWARARALPMRAQSGADLGERMHRALERCHQHGRWGIVVGTDCPGVDAEYVQAARAALELADVVLGPAADGGYGLIAARGPVPELFRDVAWGTDRVLSETLAAARRANLSTTCLDEIWDVDTVEDWRRYRKLRGRRR